MNQQSILQKVQAFDERRDIIVAGDQITTVTFSIHHFIYHAQKSIADHNYFAVALSGALQQPSIKA